MGRLLKALEGLLFPTRCPYCGRVILPGEFSCKECQPQLRRLHLPVCTKCGVEREEHHRSCGGFLCAAPFSYQGVVRKGIIDFKFHQKAPYAACFAGEIAAQIKRFGWENELQLITFVPMWSKKERERGYNQAELLARALSKELGIPCAPLLKKSFDNQIQHSLTAARRKQNVKGAFGLFHGELVKDKIILLCDDIMTTGSTLQEGAKMLEKHGAKGVYCAVIAQREVVS